MAKKITAWRRELEWMKECPVHALQNGAKDLQSAYERWWSGLGGPPRFKKKSSGQNSWRESDPACFDVNGQAIKLPKIGWVRAKISQKVSGKPRLLTVKEEGGDWYATITLQEEVEDPKPHEGTPLGLDLGVTQSATESTGATHIFGKVEQREQKRLRQLAKAVSRKKKGSKNREKAKRNLARAQRRIRRHVRHEIHVMTHQLAKNHGLIGVEDLGIQGMTASAKGTVEAPGRNVSQKRRLNREILARSWGEVVRQLEYKCSWAGSRLVKVPAAYSSQECSVCGQVSRENRKSRSLFSCVACRYEENADVNAAKVILKRALAAGHAVTACGEDVRRRLGHATSVKQEPTHGRRKRAI